MPQKGGFTKRYLVPDNIVMKKDIGKPITVSVFRGLTKVGHFAESFKGVGSCPGRVAVITDK
jgi:hypothetical protein